MLDEFRQDLKKTCNRITFSRLLFIPILLYLAYYHRTWLFLILYALQWYLDSWDGYFARKLNESSLNGALYDGIIDEIDVFFSLVYIYLFYPVFVMNNIWIIIPLIVISYFNRAIAAIFHGPKFRLHLYSGKYSVSFFHVFIIYLLVFGENYLFFYIATGFIILFLIEEFLTLSLFRNIGTDIGSILLLFRKK